MKMSELIKAKDKLEAHKQTKINNEIKEELKKSAEFARDIALMAESKNTFCLFDGAAALFLEFKNRADEDGSTNTDALISGMIAVIPYSLEEIESSLKMMKEGEE